MIDQVTTVSNGPNACILQTLALIGCDEFVRCAHRVFCFCCLAEQPITRTGSPNCCRNPNRAAMPSLIYIARIKSLPEELAKSLRSAGCHVKSFKSGDIANDECLLAMTSEAVGATFRSERDSVETGTAFAGIPAAPDMNEQLGSQAAIWSSIKTAVSRESQAERERVAPLASTEEPGLTAPEVRRPPVSRSKGRKNGEIARAAPAQIIAAVTSAEASRTPRKIRPAREQFYRFFRNPLSTVVVLVLFSVIYRGVMRRSTAGVTIRREANYAARSDSDSASHLLNVPVPSGPAARRSPQTTLSSTSRQAVDRVQRRLSPDDSVAEDFTNHLALRRPSEVTQPNPELKHPQSDSMRKRIVLDQE
jgi:hypothetical protein